MGSTTSEENEGEEGDGGRGCRRVQQRVHSQRCGAHAFDFGGLRRRCSTTTTDSSETSSAALQEAPPAVLYCSPPSAVTALSPPTTSPEQQQQQQLVLSSRSLLTDPKPQKPPNRSSNAVLRHQRGDVEAAATFRPDPLARLGHYLSTTAEAAAADRRRRRQRAHVSRFMVGSDDASPHHQTLPSNGPLARPEFGHQQQPFAPSASFNNSSPEAAAAAAVPSQQAQRYRRKVLWLPTDQPHGNEERDTASVASMMPPLSHANDAAFV